MLVWVCGWKKGRQYDAIEWYEMNGNRTNGWNTIKTTRTSTAHENQNVNLQKQANAMYNIDWIFLMQIRYALNFVHWKLKIPILCCFVYSSISWVFFIYTCRSFCTHTQIFVTNEKCDEGKYFAFFFLHTFKFFVFLCVHFFRMPTIFTRCTLECHFIVYSTRYLHYKFVQSDNPG